MKIRGLLCWTFICAILLGSCSYTTPAKDMGQIYSIALDAYMPLSEGLNGNMEYIAIDMSSFKDIDETDKKQILQYFSKYRVEVMEATLQQLEAKGLINPETKVLKGVLLRVDKTDISARQVVIEGSKFRAGDGAIGARVVVKHKNGKWQVVKAEGTWIS